MIRYTTPNIVLCVPIDITDAEKVVATFSQWNVRIDKEIPKSAMTLQEGRTVMELSLSQTETEKFKPYRKTTVQVNFYRDGYRGATRPRVINPVLINTFEEEMN